MINENNSIYKSLFLIKFTDETNEKKLEMLKLFKK